MAELEPHPKPMGAVFRDVRLAFGVGGRAAANILGVEPVRLGEWERGVSEPLSWERVFLRLIQAMFWQSLDDMFGKGGSSGG